MNLSTIDINAFPKPVYPRAQDNGFKFQIDINLYQLVAQGCDYTTTKAEPTQPIIESNQTNRLIYAKIQKRNPYKSNIKIYHLLSFIYIS